ncbi:uncharacterized protein LOC100679270 isoform X1 [Nasonia vitripennis]|uniref:Uncharacterized protein n=1 Tax=Nasonia vitripennis TaxID=7425 RepID=A0A7M7TAM1_NASVI|nr:uncharacterized protein LOC100679270 isoform X1 [Nasonia vitripennis]
MYLQIYSAIWPYIMKCCALKMLWVFLFVIVCISTFLIIMNKSSREDLKKSVLTQDTVQSIHGKINDLKQDLRTKETKSRKSNIKTLKISKKYYFTNRKTSLPNLQQILINRLKKDVLKTEEELNELEKEILLLSRRRENVKYEIAKVFIIRNDQEEYNKCMQVLLKE